MKNSKHIRTSFFYFLLFNLLCLSVQSQQIQVSTPRTLSMPPKYVSSECTLSRSNTNQNRLLATILIANPSSPKPNYHTKVLRSQDGGQSWQDQYYPPQPQAADPWGLQQANGTILIVDISEGRKFHLKVSHFDPELQHWAAPISFGFGFDHCMLLSGIESQSVYLIATQKTQDDELQFQTRILIAHSLDGGRTFPTRHFHPLVNGLEFNAKQAYLHTNGTLLIPISLRGYFFKNEESPRPFAQMQTWLYPFYNHGATPGTPSFITNLSGRKHHWLVSNAQNTKQLYFAFTDVNQQRIGLLQSYNGGTSWTSPIWIHQDSNSIKSLDLSAMAINARQEVAISWAKKVEEGCYQRMISIFTHQDQRLRSREIGPMTCPDNTNGWIKRAWPQGGDYCGLISNLDNSFYLLCSQPHEGSFRPHFTQITITP